MKGKLPERRESARGHLKFCVPTLPKSLAHPWAMDAQGKGKAAQVKIKKLNWHLKCCPIYRNDTLIPPKLIAW